jgi:transposase
MTPPSASAGASPAGERARTRKLIHVLDYKTAGAMVVSEAYTSQTCPVCRKRSKPRRISRCPTCGASGPRDAVGALTILSLGVLAPCSRVVPCHRW